MHACKSTRYVNLLTLWGLVTPYIELCQHWFRQWLVAWRHQAIAWTNADQSSVKSCGIHLRIISHEMLDTIPDMSLKDIKSRSQQHFLGANELTHCGLVLASLVQIMTCRLCSIFKRIFLNKKLFNSNKIPLKYVFDNKSTTTQSLTIPSHYLNQCWHQVPKHHSLHH